MGLEKSDAGFRGVFGIPPTPFDDAGELDNRGLEASVAFMLDAGVHGVVGPVNVSESTTLTDRERRDFVDVVVGAVAGAVPFVAAVHGPSAHHARAYARHAKRSGADALIAMPPYGGNPGAAEVIDYYRAIGAESDLPVFVQNHRGPPGHPLPVAAVVGIAREVDEVLYVKEETDAGPRIFTELREAASSWLLGIMGGRGGLHLPDEHRRGACGTMPSAAFVDIIVQLWNALEDGDTDQVDATYERLLPLAVMEGQIGAPTMAKEMLRRRGILTDTSVRQPGLRPLDDFDHERLGHLLTRASTYIREARI